MYVRGRSQRSVLDSHAYQQTSVHDGEMKAARYDPATPKDGSYYDPYTPPSGTPSTPRFKDNAEE